VYIYEPQQLAAVTFDEQILTLAKTPILGICLGHQLIAHHYGATIEALQRLLINKISLRSSRTIRCSSGFRTELRFAQPTTIPSRRWQHPLVGSRALRSANTK